MSDPTDDLLADLDAEFGKKKKEKVLKLKEAAKKLSRSQFVNNSDWRAAQLMQEANEAAKRLAQLEHLWKPEAKETWLMRQHCSCCGGYVDYIAGEYVRYRNRQAHCIMQKRTESCSDTFHFGDIPEEFVHLEQDVARCFKCIKDERQVDEIWKHVQAKIENEAELELLIPGIDS